MNGLNLEILLLLANLLPSLPLVRPLLDPILPLCPPTRPSDPSITPSHLLHPSVDDSSNDVPVGAGESLESDVSEERNESRGSPGSVVVSVGERRVGERGGDVAEGRGEEGEGGGDEGWGFSVGEEGEEAKTKERRVSSWSRLGSFRFGR